MGDINSISDRDGQPAHKGRWTRRGVLLRLVLVLTGILPLVVLEATLRLLDIGRPADSADPLAGFSRNFPLFEQRGSVYRTIPAREPFFVAQEFPVEKPTNGFRIFCFGGSTIHGHPYQNDTAIPQWLEMELAGGDPSRKYQVVNCGGVSYASYRLAPIVKEVLNYQPDLIVVATGENEFLEDRTYESLKRRSATRAWLEDFGYSLRMVNLARQWYHGSTNASGMDAGGETQLSPEVKPRLDEPSGYASYRRDDAWHDRVAMQFNESIRAMVSMCRSARVPILFIKLGSNLRDCPPYKSEHKPGLSPEQEATWQTAFEAATASEDTELHRALALYQKAEAIDGEYALLSFRLARVLDRLGRKSEAHEYYFKAKEQDICPLRILRRNEDTLAAVATETKTPLVDAAGLLAGKSPDGIPGNDWFVDHVHPNIGGSQKIAQAVANQVRAAGIITNTLPWPEQQRREAYARHLNQLGPTYLANGRRRVEWLENWARRQRLFDETLPKDARGFLHAGFRRLDLGDDDGAWDISEALKRDAGMMELIKQHAEELHAQGRPDAAKKLLQYAAKPSGAPASGARR